MKKLFTATLLFSLLFIGCEKECPECPVITDEELCWECITKEKARYYYCPSVTGPSQDVVVLKSEMLCGLTQEQIDAKIEANYHQRIVQYKCGYSNSKYDYIRYERYMICTLLEN